MDGLPFQQDDSQVQILTVGHSSSADDGEVEPAMSCTHSQSKQDLRVTMLKKGTVATGGPQRHPPRSGGGCVFGGFRVGGLYGVLAVLQSECEAQNGNALSEEDFQTRNICRFPPHRSTPDIVA